MLHFASSIHLNSPKSANKSVIKLLTLALFYHTFGEQLSYYYFSASMVNPRQGKCTDEFYAEVVTGSNKGPVGLVEPCPGIFLAAVNVQKGISFS